MMNLEFSFFGTKQSGRKMGSYTLRTDGHIQEKKTTGSVIFRERSRFSHYLKRFSYIVSGGERTFTFRVSLNTLPTLATLVCDISSFSKDSAKPMDYI